MTKYLSVTSDWNTIQAVSAMQLYLREATRAYGEQVNVCLLEPLSGVKAYIDQQPHSAWLSVMDETLDELLRSGRAYAIGGPQTKIMKGHSGAEYAFKMTEQGDLELMRAAHDVIAEVKRQVDIISGKVIFS